MLLPHDEFVFAELKREGKDQTLRLVSQHDLSSMLRQQMTACDGCLPLLQYGCSQNCKKENDELFETIFWRQF